MNDLPDDVRKALKGLKDVPAQYPPDLHTAARGIYIAQVRKAKKKPGCPLFGSIVLAVVMGIFHILHVIF